MPVTLYSPCECPIESKMQALARLNNNLVILFSAMATGFDGRTVSLVGTDGCGCSEAQILAAINANIVEFGSVFTGGGGMSWVDAPATSTSPGTEGEVAFDGSYFYIATGTNQWVRGALSDWT